MKQRQNPKLSACRWVVLLTVVSAPARSLILGPAQYYEEITFPTLTLGQSIDLPETLHIHQLVPGKGNIDATAQTMGGVLPSSAVELSLEGTGPNTLTGRAIAITGYQWAVEHLAGPPLSSVPVVIRVINEVVGSKTGDAGFGELISKAVVFSGTTNILEAKLLAPGSLRYDRTLRKHVAPDTPYWVSLYSQAGAANAHFGGTIGMYAFTDPLVMIDPTFARKDDFRVIFSPGIGVQQQPPAPGDGSIPEPATAFVLATGALCLGRRRRSLG